MFGHSFVQTQIIGWYFPKHKMFATQCKRAVISQLISAAKKFNLSFMARHRKLIWSQLINQYYGAYLSGQSVSPKPPPSMEDTPLQSNKEISRSGEITKKKISSTEVKLFTCSFCGKYLSTSGRLKTHKTVNTEVKPFSCALIHWFGQDVASVETVGAKYWARGHRRPCKK